MNKTPITESTELEVGKFYYVLCAIIECSDGEIYHPPIYGEEHKDPQLGFRHKHYHIDGRFTTGKTNFWYEAPEFNTDKNGITNGVIQTEELPNKGKFIGTEVRRLKCRRLTTGIHPPNAALDERRGTDYRNWYTSMIGKSCAGKRCPHLGTLMKPDEGTGLLVCPLHDLHGCPDTEVIVQHPRTPQPTPVKTFLQQLNANEL